MPFRFSNNKNAETPRAPDFALLIIRVISMVALGYYQIFNHIKSVWEFLWEQKNWELITQVEKLGIPFPTAIAVTLIFLILLSMIGIFIGIFTRVNALFLFVLLGFVLVAPILLSHSLNPQTILLYLGMLFALVFSGGGQFSLDKFLAMRKAREIQRR